MDEELIELTTEEVIKLKTEEIITNEVNAEDLEQNIETEEIVEAVEVDTIEEIEIEIEEAVGWAGGDSTRHYSLYGRDEANQHPITAITGLREELNDIEALDVVYSNERNQANYYLWEDENILQENRVGYFVSACSDINKIKLCTSDNDIFGVTVDNAGFIGAQSDIARDIKYGLVVSTGVVHVRCEQTVNVGDYVISNNYGYAQKNKNGFKVVGRHQIDGIEYAEITLAAPINRICQLSDDVEDASRRIKDTEDNIVAAMNTANAAYNKAGEAVSVSEEAVKEALEALAKSEETSGVIKDLANNISENNRIAIEARKIAEDASNAAITAKDDAIATSNEAFKNVNDLIETLEPITTWTDESGNVGAEYLTNYIDNGLATNTYVAEVENKTEENKTAIQTNGKSIQTMIFSIDKYSVGEYSQSYGLTHEQAISILKKGMIYVPTKHSDTRSHSEIFEDTGEVNEFTPENHYEWDGNDWIEILSSVVFFSEKPAPIGNLKYWYIDSDKAPDGYEPYTLYMYEGDKWVKVNIFYNNPSNRMASAISQEVDNISLEVTNARGSYTGLDARLTNVDSQLQLATFWNNPDSGKSNLAAVKLNSSDNGSNLALVVMSQDGERQLSGASIVLGENDEKSYIALDADNINLEGYTTINNGFTIDQSGYMHATAGGTIGGWTIGTSALSSTYGGKTTGLQIPSSGVWAIAVGATSADMWSSAPFRVDHSGNMYATSAYIEGEGTFQGRITATSGYIGGWTLDTSGSLYYQNGSQGCGLYGHTAHANIAIHAGANQSNIGGAPFRVYHDGSVYASKGTIGGCTLDNGTLKVGTNNIKSGAVTAEELANGSVTNIKVSDVSATKITAGNIYASGGIYIGTDTNRRWQIKSNGINGVGERKESDGYTYGYDVSLYGSGLRIAGTINGGGATTFYDKNWINVAQALNASSDKKIKKNIDNFNEKHEIFFNNLMPCTFEYIYQNRFNTQFGFIAQEVDEDRKKAELSEEDVGALIYYPNNKNTNNSEWDLYKDNFISLNTWQIQKLKARVAELEAKLETLIKE